MREKITVISLLVFFLAGAVVFGVFSYKNQRKHLSQNSIFPVTVVRNLTEDDKRIYKQRLEAAQTQLEQLKKNHIVDAKDLFSVYMQIGAQYYGLGQLADAREYYLKAIDQTSGNYNGWVALYRVSSEQGDNSTAKDAILKALDLKPNDPDIWKKYIVLMQDRFNESTAELLSLYSQALEKTNNNPDIIVFYAQFLEQAGDKKAALEQWQKAVSLVPDNTEYRQELERLKILIK